jgi:membrane protease YdiL (CAAX protease family)
MENLTEKSRAAVHFRFRDIITLLIVPLQFLTAFLFRFIPATESDEAQTVAMAVLQIATVTAIFALHGEFLKARWLEYRKRLWLKILISIAGTVALHLLLKGVRILLPVRQALQDAGDPGEGSDVTLMAPLLLLLSTIVPTLAPFLEEMVFRHILFYKFRGSKLLLPLFFVASSALFGAMHLNNFDGDLLMTVPYMFAGAFFALVYFFTKNIWYSIGVHLVFNASNSLLPVVFLLIMQAVAA